MAIAWFPAATLPFLSNSNVFNATRLPPPLRVSIVKVSPSLMRSPAATPVDAGGFGTVNRIPNANPSNETRFS